ncbi:ATP-grasp domain-containing protein [Candidatus Dependentiae bacterium]|nr:ATP-grasp domain-containing protein [Candidatus Dependentiae bacterium]
MKLRVGVLIGGISVEREVSFNSGRTICDHLDTTRYSIVPIFQRIDGKLFLLPWHFMHRGKISDFEHRLENEAQHVQWQSLKQHIDFMYIATHGRYAEDGILQGMLEVLDIPYLGSKVFASAMGMNKTMQNHLLRIHGIDVPRGITVSPEHILAYSEYSPIILQAMDSTHIAFPCIVKPQEEGSSIGISYVACESDLYSALYKACTTHHNKYQSVLIEEVLTGMEFSCVTLFDYKNKSFIPLPPTEIIPESHIYDYEQKYMPGRALKFTPARCTLEQTRLIQETCVRVMELLNFTTMSRIDGFLTPDDRVVIIDPNTLSGMGPASFIFLQAAEANMSHTDLINHLIETELEHYGMLAPILEQERIHESMNSSPKKIRVAVLMGGDSNEREISLESGRNVVYKLSPTKYEALPLFVTQDMQLYRIDQRLLVRSSTKEIARDLDQNAHIAWDDLSTIADFAFIALHGGKGENGCVQGALEMLQIPYNGSGVLASSLCMDKYKTVELLRGHGFDVPLSHLLTKHRWLNGREASIQEIVTLLSFPLIVKPHDDGCSVMVNKITNLQELNHALDELFAHNKEYAMIEEFIHGMELTVGVVGNFNPQALPPSQAVASQGVLSITEKFLPGAGENQTPAPLPSNTLTFIRERIAYAFKVVGGRGYARIDCFYQAAEQSPTGQERLIILEINSLPALTPATCLFHQAAEVGMKPMELIDLIITLGFEEHRDLEPAHLVQGRPKHISGLQTK